MKLDRRHIVLVALLIGLPLVQALGNRDRASMCRFTATCPADETLAVSTQP